MGSAIGQRLRRYADHKGRGYPDWALRYIPILRALKKFHGEKAIIEIGANACTYGLFAKTQVIAVDRSVEGLNAARDTGWALPVVADIAGLPFANGVAGVCVCADTLEHIAPDKRTAAVTEIVRVLSREGAAALTFPSGDAALQAEQDIQREYESLTGNRLPWWDEHEEYGLPYANEIIESITTMNRKAGHTSINSTSVWRWMWRVLLCEWPGRGNSIAQVVLLWLTPLLAHMHSSPCYRSLIIVEPRHE